MRGMTGPLLTRLFGPWVMRVDRHTLRSDAVAGVLGALLVLPQGFAFARLAGLPPEYGLYSAIVPCIISALFGSSWHVVSGPNNANSLALFATLAPLAVVGSPAYIEFALTVTVLVGLMEWLIGVLRLGSVANFISPSALRGFMTGAAALIVVNTLPDLLGLAPPERHGTVAVLLHVGTQILQTHPSAVLVGVITFASILVVRLKLPKWPYMLIGLTIGTAVATLVNHFALALPAPWGGVEVVGTIPPIVPRFHMPVVQLADLPELVSIAFALTIVALGQSVSIAKAVAARSGQLIDTNREFRGQGLGNLVGGFFSCYVAGGSLNRSMPNFEAGARTPLAAVFSAVWLLVLLAFTAPLLALIPRTAIAAMLLLIAWSLFDIPGWRRLWRVSHQDFAIAAVTALATMTIRIEMAILLGTILSLVTYLWRTSRPFVRIMGFADDEPDRPFIVRADTTSPLPECPQLRMVRMEGEVYFGAVPYVSDHLRELREAPAAAKHLLVMVKSMNFIDVPAADMWRTEMHERREQGGDLYFHRPRPPVMQLWRRIGFVGELGADHIFATKRIAIATIFDRLDRDICAACTVRLYDECKRLPPPVAAVADAPEAVKMAGVAGAATPVAPGPRPLGPKVPVVDPLGGAAGT